VRDYMTPDVPLLRADDTIKNAARFFRKYKIDAAPVLDDRGTMCGILTTADIVGAYELTGRQRDFTLLPQKIDCLIENGRVIIKMANPLKEYPLIKTWSVLVQPLSPSEGIIVGLGQRKGDTVRREMVNGVPHILIAGLDYKKIPGPKH